MWLRASTTDAGSWCWLIGDRASTIMMLESIHRNRISLTLIIQPLHSVQSRYTARIPPLQGSITSLGAMRVFPAFIKLPLSFNIATCQPLTGVYTSVCMLICRFPFWAKGRFLQQGNCLSLFSDSSIIFCPYGQRLGGDVKLIHHIAPSPGMATFQQISSRVGFRSVRFKTLELLLLVTVHLLRMESIEAPYAS